MNVFEECATADVEGNSLQGDELFGLPVRRGEIDLGTGRAAASVHLGELADHLVRLANARLRLRGASLGSAAQPFELGVNAVLERLLPLFLRVQILFLGFNMTFFPLHLVVPGGRLPVHPGDDLQHRAGDVPEPLGAVHRRAAGVHLHLPDRGVHRAGQAPAALTVNPRRSRRAK